MKTIKGCTVKELREFLAKLPDELTVEVVREETKGYSTYTTWEALVLPTDESMNNSDTVYVGDKYIELGSR
jgi:hypothetical protein